MKAETHDLRKDFPILSQTIKGHPLVYLDNAASTQKPIQVIDAISHFYRTDYANVHRGVHELSRRATDAYEGAREKIRSFLNAASNREIIFVRGATEAINLVARSWGGRHLKPGDEVLISAMEHHSDIVPWQRICSEKGAILKVIPMLANGELDMDAYRTLLGQKTRLVGCVHLSNSLGTINDIRGMAALAHEHGALFLADGAQAAAHMTVDVRNLDCDFYTLSAHKMYGPSGIGALYARESVLKDMDPYQSGGDMILSVTFEKTLYNDLPHRFEAGTPDMAGSVGFAAAIDYLKQIGFDTLADHESKLMNYALKRLGDIPGLTFVGTAAHRASVISFTLQDIHPHDVGTLLDDRGVAVRTGHHCTQPVMDYFGIPATTRASLGLYNTTEDIDRLRDALLDVVRLFNG